MVPAHPQPTPSLARPPLPPLARPDQTSRFAAERSQAPDELEFAADWAVSQLCSLHSHHVGSQNLHCHINQMR